MYERSKMGRHLRCKKNAWQPLSTQFNHMLRILYNIIIHIYTQVPTYAVL